MRILILSRDESGLEQASRTAARWRFLRDQGIELVILVSSREQRTWEEQGIYVYGTGGRTILQRLMRLYIHARKKAAVADLITAQDPFELGCIAWRVACFSGKRFEIQDHGGFFDGGRIQEPLWWIRQYVARFLMRRASAIRTVSPKSLERLQIDHQKDGAYFLPIAVEDRFYHAHRQPDPDLIVTVARLVPGKGLEVLFDVFAEWHHIRPQSRLVVVGEGKLRRALEQRREALQLGSSVEFVGNTDPLPFLERAFVFVLLSDHEGWGVAAVEAATAGVPVVMTDTGCGSWLAKQGAAKLVPVGADVSRIVRTIEEAFHQPKTSEPLPFLSVLDTARLQVAEWHAIIRRGPRLLVCVQAVDDIDPLMGFFVEWLRQAALVFSRITVLALRVGSFDLPPSVYVIPLRGRSSRSRLRVIANIFRYSVVYRHRFDAVFIRGDAQYVALTTWLWKLLGKRVIFWYAHFTARSMFVYAAWHMADRVVTSVRAACSFSSAIPIGQAITPDSFVILERTAHLPPSLLVFGRVSSSKRTSWILSKMRDFAPLFGPHVTLVGMRTDADEGKRVTELVQLLGARWDERDIPYRDVPIIFGAYDIFLNATSGSLDKVIVEAMLSGMLVIATTPGFGEMLPVDLAWLCPTDDLFGQAILRAISLSADERITIGVRLRVLAFERHTVHGQVHRLREVIEQTLPITR